MSLDLGAQLRASQPPVKGPPCTMGVILSELDKDDRSALVEALIDRTVEHTTIYRVLTGNGFKVSINTVQRHRRGECRCGAQ